jgi:hypothetical protein
MDLITLHVLFLNSGRAGALVAFTTQNQFTANSIALCHGHRTQWGPHAVIPMLSHTFKTLTYL